MSLDFLQERTGATGSKRPGQQEARPEAEAEQAAPSLAAALGAVSGSESGLVTKLKQLRAQSQREQLEAALVQVMARRHPTGLAGDMSPVTWAKRLWERAFFNEQFPVARWTPRTQAQAKQKAVRSKRPGGVAEAGPATTLSFEDLNSMLREQLAEPGSSVFTDPIARLNRQIQNETNYFTRQELIALRDQAVQDRKLLALQKVSGQQQAWIAELDKRLKRSWQVIGQIEAGQKQMETQRQQIVAMRAAVGSQKIGGEEGKQAAEGVELAARLNQDALKQLQARLDYERERQSGLTSDVVRVEAGRTPQFLPNDRGAAEQDKFQLSWRSAWGNTSSGALMGGAFFARVLAFLSDWSPPGLVLRGVDYGVDWVAEKFGRTPRKRSNPFSDAANWLDEASQREAMWATGGKAPQVGDYLFRFGGCMLVMWFPLRWIGGAKIPGLGPTASRSVVYGATGATGNYGNGWQAMVEAGAYFALVPLGQELSPGARLLFNATSGPGYTYMVTVQWGEVAKALQQGNLGQAKALIGQGNHDAAAAAMILGFAFGVAQEAAAPRGPRIPRPRTQAQEHARMQRIEAGGQNPVDHYGFPMFLEDPIPGLRGGPPSSLPPEIPVQPRGLPGYRTGQGPAKYEQIINGGDGTQTAASPANATTQASAASGTTTTTTTATATTATAATGTQATGVVQLPRIATPQIQPGLPASPETPPLATPNPGYVPLLPELKRHKPAPPDAARFDHDPSQATKIGGLPQEMTPPLILLPPHPEYDEHGNLVMTPGPWRSLDPSQGDVRRGHATSSRFIPTTRAIGGPAAAPTSAPVTPLGAQPVVNASAADSPTGVSASAGADAAKTGQGGHKRVEDRVPGFFAGIHAQINTASPVLVQQGWKFEDHVWKEELWGGSGSTKGIPEYRAETKVRSPQGGQGSIYCTYDPTNQEYRFNSEHFDTVLQTEDGWIESETTPMVAARGMSPTIRYLQLRMMKLMDQWLRDHQLGQLTISKFSSREIQNFDTIFQLKALMDQNGVVEGSPLGDLYRQTHNGRDCESNIVQAGYKILGGPEVTEVSYRAASSLLSDAVLQKLDEHPTVPLRSRLPWNFRATWQVQPKPLTDASARVVSAPNKTDMKVPQKPSIRSQMAAADRAFRQTDPGAGNPVWGVFNTIRRILLEKPVAPVARRNALAKVTQHATDHMKEKPLASIRFWMEAATLLLTNCPELGEDSSAALALAELKELVADRWRSTSDLQKDWAACRKVVEQDLAAVAPPKPATVKAVRKLSKQSQAETRRHALIAEVAAAPYGWLPKGVLMRSHTQGTLEGATQRRGLVKRAVILRRSPKQQANKFVFYRATNSTTVDPLAQANPGGELLFWATLLNGGELTIDMVRANEIHTGRGARSKKRALHLRDVHDHPGLFAEIEAGQRWQLIPATSRQALEQQSSPAAAAAPRGTVVPIDAARNNLQAAAAAVDALITECHRAGLTTTQMTIILKGDAYARVRGWILRRDEGATPEDLATCNTAERTELLAQARDRLLAAAIYYREIASFQKLRADLEESRQVQFTGEEFAGEFGLVTEPYHPVIVAWGNHLSGPQAMTADALLARVQAEQLFARFITDRDKMRVFAFVSMTREEIPRWPEDLDQILLAWIEDFALAHVAVVKQRYGQHLPQMQAHLGNLLGRGLVRKTEDPDPFAQRYPDVDRQLAVVAWEIVRYCTTSEPALLRMIVRDYNSRLGMRSIKEAMAEWRQQLLQVLDRVQQALFPLSLVRGGQTEPAPAAANAADAEATCAVDTVAGWSGAGELGFDVPVAELHDFMHGIGARFVPPTSMAEVRSQMRAQDQPTAAVVLCTAQGNDTERAPQAVLAGRYFPKDQVPFSWFRNKVTVDPDKLDSLFPQQRYQIVAWIVDLPKPNHDNGKPNDNGNTVLPFRKPENP